MQSPTGAPRDALTVEQVTGLIVEAPALVTGFGAELLDTSLAVVGDISADLAGGSVARNAYAELHGTAQLSLSTELDWGSAIVRPYYTMSDGQVKARFNLGAYYTSTPARVLGEDPPIYSVQGYDILQILNDLVGESYALPAGASPLAEVEKILQDRGVLVYFIDQSRADAVLPSARTWPIDDNVTWLTIVNDLLGAVGYLGVWSDWNGRLMCVPYENPGDRAPEWLYEATGVRSMLAPTRSVEDDYWSAPNRWVAVRSNNVDGPPPVEGAGIYTWQNDTVGPTSVQARGGRVITAPILRLDVADQAALIAAAQQRIDADMRRRSTIKLATSPNPLHWHFDRVAVADPEMGSALLDALSTSWTLPLDRGDMTHEWSTI
ncbi:hypothetical protein [Micromonospora aurantiaca (nom. illeg.)]|uniref:hypothetical protein n=1 Tax=Micromonospora aurantiaca (nom. illeg.) TaxID=47850 RepID=UPI003EBFD4CB